MSLKTRLQSWLGVDALNTKTVLDTARIEAELSRINTRLELHLKSEAKPSGGVSVEANQQHQQWEPEQSGNSVIAEPKLLKVLRD